jgi:6-pyruvoyltetrahydropterin/6-carboxytetrahydropterin synthase
MTNVRLSREVRVALHEEPIAAASPNGFAGNPMLAGIAPFVTVTVCVAGPVDPRTGMLVNIKVIDAVVREHAVPMLQRARLGMALRTADVVGELFNVLAGHFSAAQQSPQTLETVTLGLSPYLSVAVVREEKPMVRLSQRFEFSAAHRLHSETLSAAENRDVFGRCNNANGHGHNYELEVMVSGPAGATGQVVPVAELQRLVNEHVIDVFDHKHLNMDCADFVALNPTVENIAQVIYRRLAPHIPNPARLVTVKLWETPKTMCEYGE